MPRPRLPRARCKVAHHGGIGAGGCQGHAELPGDERAIGFEPIGFGQATQRILRFAIAQEQGTEIERRIDKTFVAPLVSGLQCRHRQVHAAITDLANALPEGPPLGRAPGRDRCAQ